jgi:hypothetical protein
MISANISLLQFLRTRNLIGAKYGYGYTKSRGREMLEGGVQLDRCCTEEF